MAENPTQNQFYQAPLEVPGYLNESVSKIPSQPTDVYGLMGFLPNKGKVTKKPKSAYEAMMEGEDPYAGLIPDVAPLQTNLKTLEPLDDPAGLFHSQDGFGKYGFSSILAGGDNEDRYAQNFKRDNPSLFWQSGFHPWDGIKKGFYWGGGFLEKTLESAVVKTGQGLAGLYGLTIGNTLDVMSGDKVNSLDQWLTTASDNVFSNFFDGWDENLKERYHYFQEKNDRDKKGFIASLSDGDFWMNDISDGLGFLVSAAFEVGLISKLGLGTKVATRLAPLAEGVSTEALAAQAAGRTGLQRASSFLGIESSGHALVKNAVDLTAQTLAITAIESAVEANEVKGKVYDSFEGKIDPETGYYYTEEDKNRLAAAAASEVFNQNMTILIAPKFLETLVFNRIGKFAKGIFNKAAGEADVAAGRASGRVRSKLGNLSSGTSYDKASALKNIWKVGSVAAIGFMSEGLFEENVQLAISRSAEQSFGAEDEFYRPGTSQEEVDQLKSENEIYGNVGKRYIRQSKQFFEGLSDDRAIDDELSKSVGIGGAFGVGGGIIHGSLGIRQQAKVDNYWNNRLNSATTNLFESQNFYQTKTEERPDTENPGKTKPVTTIVTDPATGQPVLDETKLKSFLNKMNNIQGIMDIVANTEDPNDESNKSNQNIELNKLARNVLFTQLAMEYVRAGKKNTLLSNLASSSQFSDKDIQALGYDPGSMTEVEKKNMLSKMTKIVERLDETDKWIENNVIDNVSEPREGFGGLRYSKAQKTKRVQEFEAKKAYLRGLAMQNTLLDSYLDEIADTEGALGEPTLQVLSSILGEDGVPITDMSVPFATVSRDYNSRMPALKNQMEILQKEFAYHWDNMLSRERNSPKGQSFSAFSQTNNGKSLAYSQMKAQETLERINNLQAEYDKLSSERNAFLNNDKAFELQEEDGEFYVVPKAQQLDQNQITLNDINNEKQRRINGVKREEIAIQKGWIQEEWKLTAALKEEKTKAERKSTPFSRRMSLSMNAYNTYFQREVMDKDNSLGQRKLKLYDKDPNKRITAKRYKSNEEKLLKAVRIQGKVQTILADINGQKLLAEIEGLLDRDVPGSQFTVELNKITDNYNGKPIIVAREDKGLVDGQLDDTQDEYNFVASIFEFMPEDERFNDKYYNIALDGSFVVKPEYDSLPDLAVAQRELQDRIDDLNKVKDYLNSIPESIPGDWNNVNRVKKRIADVYTETADSIINTYNQTSNNGQSEISGDSLSTKQDLDLIDYELDELEQLKEIFTERDKTDKILLQPEFQGFIEAIDKRIEDLKKIRAIVKERLSSRLRENQDFLVDAVSNFTEQLGLNFDGTTKNESLKTVISNVVESQLYTKFVTSLTDLKALMDKENQTAEDKKAISDAYWSINGQVSAIQEVIKAKGKDVVLQEIAKQKTEQIAKLESTALMQTLKDRSYYKDITNNINDSVLGILQLVFYQSDFSQVGVAGDTDSSFLDDQPSSPVYKFREDYNLRKFIRNVERDESRTPENTDITKDTLLEFLYVSKSLQNLEDLANNINSTLNLLDQVEKEKEVVQAKIDKKDNKYENLIIPSIQQLFYIRAIASFLRRDTGGKGFKNWIFLQAPGGAGKTQTLGTWFGAISGIPRDKVLATAFTEEAARGIKKALLVGEEGPKDATEMAAAIREFTKDKQFDHDVLIIDEFPAIDVQTQKELFDAISAYTEAKIAAGKGEFKVITLGDTNQLTFSENGSVTPRPGIITNPYYFNDNKSAVSDKHPARMQIIPSLTVNFRSNLFAITSFIDQFKGSSNETVNANTKVTSTDINLETKDVKGVVSVNKADFKTKLISYLKLNSESVRTKTLIVNESKIDEYKKLLTDNGIKIITDPNDEVTKGVYLTTVKNVQGFSFDEVYVDLENKDKTLFSGTSSPNFIYNKAMYVAASRARNLIVVTNFSNMENVQDDSINTLENKALEELQTKDTEFIANRDLEIASAKNILGDQYNRTTKAPVTTKAEDKVETVLDQEEEAEEEAEETEEEEASDITEEVVAEEPIEEDEAADEIVGNEVISTPGDEDIVDTEIEEETKKGGLQKLLTEIAESVRDKAITAFDKVRDSVVELLFPTSQSIKYKIGPGEFTVKVSDTYESRNLLAGDEVILIPFQQNSTKSPRKFGYAIVSPSIDQDGKAIPDTYKTLSILSDTEIDRLRERPETSNVYNLIEENEQRDKDFVSVLYTDVSDDNGFTTTASKRLNDLERGVVTHANSVKYFFRDTYRPMNKLAMDEMIDTFINNFYRNHLASFPVGTRGAEYIKLKNFYNNRENAQIIIPVRKDIEGNNPNLKIPPDLRTYVRAGRPYMMFKPFHARSTMQFIALSRKYLSTTEHNDAIAPIREFVGLAKVVRTMLEGKGITNKLGYSRSLSSMLSKLANDYVRNPNNATYTARLAYATDGVRGFNTFTFSAVEAERIYNLYSLYSQPNTNVIEAKTEKEIQNLTKVKRARNYTFEDGDTIYGIIESYDPTSKTFVVKDLKSEEKETYTKSGVITHTGKASVGQAQQAIDDIMNSNGHIASKFAAIRGRTGFVTDKDRSGNEAYKGYKFMALLGSKTGFVVKSYYPDGTVKEFYGDVIEIIEDLFNFGVRGEIPAKNLNYINEEGTIQNISVKFRVPVPLNARTENGQLEFDYTYSPQNTSRDTSVPNSRFFETNFDTLSPSRIFIEFGKEAVVEQAEEVQVVEAEEPEVSFEEPALDITTLSPEDIASLPFSEIRRRLTPEQVRRVDEWARLPENGFNGIDHFFEVAESNLEAEQGLFRDYLIECLL